MLYSLRQTNMPSMDVQSEYNYTENAMELAE